VQYELTLPQFVAAENTEYFQFLSEQGLPVMSSMSMPAGQMLAMETIRPPSSYLNIALPDGRNGRLLRTRFLPRVDFDGVNGPAFQLDPVMLERFGRKLPSAIIQATLTKTGAH